MLTYEHVDDGWFCVGYWILDGDHIKFAEAPTEAAAKEICDAVNVIRKLGARLHEVAQGG